MTKSSGDARAMRSARTGSIAASMVFAATACAVAWPFTVDDAFVTASYARHLARGVGYTMDGGANSDGVTGALWLLPFLFGEWLAAVEAMVVAKVVGGGSALVTLWLLLRGMTGRHGARRLVPYVAGLVVTQADMWIWAVGGLETGLATLVLAMSVMGVASHRIRDDRVVAAVSVALLMVAWLRPEMLVAAAAVVMVAAWRAHRSAWLWAASLGLGVVSVIGFRMVMFGHALPLSVLAKPASLTHGFRYVSTAAVICTGGVGSVLFVFGMWRGQRRDRTVGMVALTHVAAVLLAGGDWMPGFRLLVPALPLYAWVAAVGASRVRRAWIGHALVVAACALPLVNLAVQVPRARASGEDRSSAGTELAVWLAEHACHVALVDVGFLPYQARVRVFDLAGITDAAVARLPGGHVGKQIPDALLRLRDPDTVVLRGIERVSPDAQWPFDPGWHSLTESELARSSFVTASFTRVHVVQYAPGYVYYVLQRDGAQRCPSR